MTMTTLRSMTMTTLDVNQWRAEAVGCPGPTRFLDALENILYSSCKISDDLFLVVHLNFSLFSHQLSNFTRIRSSEAPLQCCIIALCPGNDIFLLLFWSFTYIFLRKLAPWMPPQGGCP